MVSSCFRYLVSVIVITVLLIFSFPAYSKSSDANVNVVEPNALKERRLDAAEKSDKLQANTAPHGQLLYENHCRVCHDSNAHVRDKKKAKSKADILYWVNRWSTHLELKWSIEDKSSVVEHLNATYYKY